MNHKAVLVSDVHFSLSSLEIADRAFRLAIDKAQVLGVDLISCGDLLTDKAMLRAEVVNRLIQTMKYAATKKVEVFCLVGNHDLLNEKGTENALNFLHELENVYVISETQTIKGLGFIPYQSSTTRFLDAVQSFPDGAVIVAHQGTHGGQLGHYVSDQTSFDPQSVHRLRRVFLGHYHAGYELLNTVSIGTPYTTSFGEANDIPKGFIILNEDGSYERVPTNLRKHVILEGVVSGSSITYCNNQYSDIDLVWVKLQGSREDLARLTKKQVGEELSLKNFKLDKIATDLPKVINRSLRQTSAE